jgi:16S rRNA (guanine(966)-N(2))-methyltransferase RsmD
MRIIAGHARGRRLKTRKGSQTRPTADKVKESLFNILAARITGSRFLDVFAGNGGVGIEALSRGAEKCVFIEKNLQCAKIIKDNLLLAGVDHQAEILNLDAKVALASLVKKQQEFDLIFFDPPYHSPQLGPALQDVATLLSQDGLVIVEHHALDLSWFSDSSWTRIREKKYGDTALSFLTPAAATADAVSPEFMGGETQ